MWSLASLSSSVHALSVQGQCCQGDTILLSFTSHDAQSICSIYLGALIFGEQIFYCLSHFLFVCLLTKVYLVINSATYVLLYGISFSISSLSVRCAITDKFTLLYDY